MGDIRLVVQGDDLGMCRAVNEGIALAHAEGILTQASVMAPTPWFAEGAAMARRQGLPVGLHVTLTCEWEYLRWGPLTPGPSLRGDDGTPVMSGDGDHGFSPLMEHWIAGILATLREFTLLYAPTINSYKRYAKGSFAPTGVAWGVDNRTCALRVVGHGSSLRVENRVPGGDVNPYLGIAAIIAGRRTPPRMLLLPEPYGGTNGETLPAPADVLVRAELGQQPGERLALLGGQRPGPRRAPLRRTTEAKKKTHGREGSRATGLG